MGNAEEEVFQATNRNETNLISKQILPLNFDSNIRSKIKLWLPHATASDRPSGYQYQTSGFPDKTNCGKISILK